EAAHFEPASIARTARRHKLPSEASRRFERGVDPELQPYAAALAAKLLVEHGGGTVTGGAHGGPPRPPLTRSMDVGLPGAVAGLTFTAEQSTAVLVEVGCAVTARGDELEVTPPSWRPDLTDPYDLVEEVARIVGYDEIPSVLPQARPGRGLTS